MSDSRAPTHEQHAREILGLPPEWEMVIWQRTGKPPNYSGTTVTGAVMREMFQRGPRKGRPNWAKRDLGTECTITILDALHEAWLAKWEADTGKCHRCSGSGQEVCGWSKEGVKRRVCSRCGGTGVPVGARNV